MEHQDLNGPEAWAALCIALAMVAAGAQMIINLLYEWTRRPPPPPAPLPPDTPFFPPF
jgi:hypothetical protein